MNEKIKIIGFAGSMRKSSYNKSLLKTVKELFPADMEMEIVEMPDIRMYNYDIQESEGIPPSVAEIGEKIIQSDAVLIVTPEYNYSIPGGLKNFIDWLSRLESKPFTGKPIGIMGATPGLGGTIRAQVTLRTVALFIEANIMTKPEIYITRAMEKFDNEGNLTDEITKKVLEKYIERFKEWILIFKNNKNK